MGGADSEMAIKEIISLGNKPLVTSDIKEERISGCRSLYKFYDQH